MIAIKIMNNITTAHGLNINAPMNRITKTGSMRYTPNTIILTTPIIPKIINPIINAYCTPTFDLAREMAKRADDSIKKGEKLGLLHGIPISIKDEVEMFFFLNYIFESIILKLELD